jgi:hypothetical protein
MEKWFIVGLAVALVMAGVFANFASPDPDGLERVAEDLEFIDYAADPAPSPIPDYEVQEAGPFSVTLAGVIGVLLTLLLVLGVAWILKKNGA